MPNRLASELSPYLLQHADNPVDWHPWGEDAFARAREESKPIFLSVGYSTCHWCHVMEHESFESSEVAELLNRHFVSIKVDREERPDVDRVYMTFVQATTGSGGWPMSVWLTPDLKPFFGGTYFPPSSRWGRPGFTEILQETARLWAEERPKLIESADTLMARLEERQRAVSADDGNGAVIAEASTLDEGVNQFKQAFDATHGGFGNAPKFPRPSELLFLLREHRRAGHQDLRTMVVETLRAMANGGMRDHVGGGFHRYSVDAQWRIPHFEKMLYDQAQLTLAYLEAGQLTGDRRFVEVAADTLAYVARDLTSPEGAFFSAEDADSLPPEHTEGAGSHKTEGAFYVWTSQEIDEALDGEASLAKQWYGVESGGNATDDPTGELRGKNHLYLARSLEELAASTGRSSGDLEAVLARVRARLFEVRSRRPRPHLDDKVLTAWNGLMIAAWARAAHVVEGLEVGDAGGATTDGMTRADSALAHAQRASRFIHDTLWDGDAGVLCRRYRGGQASIAGYSEDYAFLIWGLLELFQVDGDVAWLEWALALQTRQDELFWDDQGGGWFSTTGTDPSVLLRMKEDYDGAEPSAGSVATMNLLTLVHLTGDGALRDRLEAALGRFGPRLGHASRVVPLLTAALSSHHAGSIQVVIIGDRKRPDTVALRRAVARTYLPFAVRINVEPGPSQERLGGLLPFVASMTERDGKATAYVCADFACQEPVTDPKELDNQLTATGGPGR